MSGKNPFLSFGFVSPFITFIRASISKNLFLGASLDLNFTENLSLIDDISGNNLVTFSRASTGTYVGSDGLIKTAVADAPRFDHDPVTGESLGLLIEESRANKMLNSGTTAEMVATSQTTRTSGGFAAPDGSTDASRVDLPAVTGANIVQIITEQLGSLPANTNHTASIYLKGVNGGELVYLTLESGNPTSFVAANLTTEWQRFDITGLSSGSGLLFFNVGVDTRSGTGQTNQPAQSFFAWGAQVEAGSFPTSYIPTTSSTVTRAADVASITGTNFSSWYNQSEGTMFSDTKITFNDANVPQFPTVYTTNSYPNRLWSLYVNSAATNRISIGADAFSNNFGSGVSSPQTFKVVQAISNTTSTYSASKDGGAVIAGSVSAVADQTIMSIGPETGGTKLIKRLTYYPYRLADATLQEITS